MRMRISEDRVRESGCGDSGLLGRSGGGLWRGGGLRRYMLDRGEGCERI